MRVPGAGREKGRKEYNSGDASTGSINCSCSLAPRFCRYCNYNKSALQITSPGSSELISSSAYLDNVRGLLQGYKHKGAFEILRTALDEHPFDPFLLSYYGCLDAIVNKNYDNGVDVCKNAIDILEQDVPFGKEDFYPLFYLNLGRAYLAGGNKKNAAEAFKKGLEADPRDSDLLWEVSKIGMRRKPVVPILKRSNPINKYIGRLFHTTVFFISQKNQSYEKSQPFSLY